LNPDSWIHLLQQLPDRAQVETPRAFLVAEFTARPLPHRASLQESAFKTGVDDRKYRTL